MFQTWWDINKQNVRKALDMLGGAVTALGASHGQWGVVAASIVLLGLNYAWFWVDNRNKMTVKGLEAAGASHAAAVVEAVVEAKK